jgi:hypothetical protein
MPVVFVPPMTVALGLPDRVGALPDPFFPIRSHRWLLAASRSPRKAILVPPG